MPEFEQKSPYRVAVQRDMLGMGVAITFGLVYGGEEISVMQYGVQEWHQQDRNIIVEKPTMRLEEDFARALYEQLGYYFNGQPDITSSRADYLEERKAHALAEQRHHELAMKTIDAMGEMAAMEADLAAK